MTRFLEYWILLSYESDTHFCLVCSQCAHTHTYWTIFPYTHNTERHREVQRDSTNDSERNKRQKNDSEKVYHFTRKVFHCFLWGRRREDGSGQTIACYDDAKWYKPRKMLNINSKSSCAATCTFSNENEREKEAKTKRKQIRTKTHEQNLC